MSVVILKAGDTLSLAGTYTDSDGAAISLTGYTIASSVRQSDGTLVENLTCTITVAASGTFSVSATATQTSDWPTESLSCDIEFSVGGVVVHTDTFTIVVQEAIT